MKSGKARLILALIMSAMMSMTAFAGVWKTGAEPNQNRWWYDNEDGTYAQNGWHWIDGNGDGVEECYYFDGSGWMLASTTTPDNYQVNESGAWVDNGTVQTRQAAAQSAPAAQTETQQTEETAATTETTAGNGTSLVVYFSRTGTTQTAANEVARLTGSDTVRLEVADPYPSSYEQTLSRAQRELNAGARPALTTTVSNMADYDTVYVGYPIWYGDAPMAIYTFLESYDFAGKTIVPFCTSGSSGISTSMSRIRSACPNSTVLQGLRVGSTSAIQPWLSQIGVLQ